MTARIIGERVSRLEDQRLVRGAGCFLDDIHLPECLETAFVRSDHAHAVVTHVDASEGRDTLGVVAVYTHSELGDFDRPLPLGMLGPGLHHPRGQLPLVRDRVRFVGEPIAMVVAVNREIAEDAAAKVVVEYDPLPPVISLEGALDNEMLVHGDVRNNVAASIVHVKGDPTAVFDEAPHVVSRKLWIERSAAMPIETRGVAAQLDSAGERLTVYDSTQWPTSVCSGLAAFLGIPEHNVNVVAPDIGGGFGVKIAYWYPEEVLVPFAAINLKRAVKWVEDRREHFVASNHERGQIHEARLAVDDEGKILALESQWKHDTGAYVPYGVTVPLVTSMSMPGPYRVPHYRSECQVIYTNTRPVTPYRGAGYPEGCFVMERMLDAAAQQLGLSRVDIRRRNLLRPNDFPYKKGIKNEEGRPLENEDGSPVEYDSGDPQKLLEDALKLIGYEEVDRDKENAGRRGLRVGLGLASYMEMTGAQLYEGARVRVEPSGKVLVATGASSQGQGHETVLAQIAAETLGVPLQDVKVIAGDTRQFKGGIGTYASRIAVVSGNAVAGAATMVREKILRLAAEVLETAAEDLTIEDGRVFVRGAQDQEIKLHELAHLATPVRVAYDEASLAASQFATRKVPALQILDEPGLEATYYYQAPRSSSAGGCHAVVVEIDPETFELKILRYVVVHDSGRLINPMIVEGQIMGGVAQGIGGAYYERIHYDEWGQPVNASFMDFLIPYSTEIPEVVIEHVEVPATANPLGVKGCGEAGVIPVSAALVSAIEDALGINIPEAPLSPNRLFELVTLSGHEEDAKTEPRIPSA